MDHLAKLVNDMNISPSVYIEPLNLRYLYLYLFVFVFVTVIPVSRNSTKSDF